VNEPESNVKTAPNAHTRLALVFSCAGHFQIHFLTAFFFTIVLSLEDEWQLPYHELIGLWWLGGLLVGLAALPAGRLADKWSVAGMMVIFFLGMGSASIVAGTVSSPTAMLLSLAGIGLFAGIYHPVGIPWVIRSAPVNTGKLLAVNGVFGSLGAAAAGSVSGVLAETCGWRAAFVLPGLVCFSTGIAMLWVVLAGRITDQRTTPTTAMPSSRAEMLRVFLVLVVSMFIAGVIFQGSQAALPKLFSERLPVFVEGSAFRAGLLVTIVYAVAGFVQLLGGMLADRYPLRRVYTGAWVFQIACLAALAGMAGSGLFLFALLSVSLSVTQLPAENMLLARYAPPHHHGLAFGAKFVLAFGATPIAVALIAWVRGLTGDFLWFFAGLALAAVAVVVLLRKLPEEETGLRAQAAVRG
jgi:MFS family permease